VDRADASEEVRQRGLDAVERHKEAIDKLYGLQESGVNISSLASSLRKVEDQAAEYYSKLLEDDLISSPKTLQRDELAVALRDATGINPLEKENKDAELFHIMVKQWDHEPPASALGVSAKFYVDGRVEKARYHVALHLPCSDSWDAHRLAMSARAAAKSLRAPALVDSWVTMVEKLPENSIESLGFGVALLGDGSRAGKIYITNPGGSPMPHLPLGGGKVLGDVLPTVGQSLDANMVSLEWVAGDERVALRHYAIQRHVSHEQRVLDFTGPGPLSSSILDLMKMADSATETVRYTPPFTEKEVSTSGQAPKLSKSKLGLQLADEYMADERFVFMTTPILKLLGVDEKRVRSWVSSSSQLGHTVSNIQAGSSYITLYRHPLHLCSLQQRVTKRRLSTKGACQIAQDTFRGHMWGGDCSQAMKVSSACESCKSNSGGNWNGSCYQDCVNDWTKPCHSNCSLAIDNLIQACSGCQISPTWCGKPGADGIPSSFPLAACQSCDSDATSCSDKDKVCVDWMASNHPSAVFDKEFDDGDIMMAVQSPLSNVPDNCKYPMNPWLSGKYPLCNKCTSLHNGMYQQFLWGGPCSYEKACDKEKSPVGRSLGAEQCATSKQWKCGCGCGEILAGVSEKCTAGQDLCQAAIPARCKTDDDDVHNKCDYDPYNGLANMFIWGEKMRVSKCYVNGKFATQCVQDKAYNTDQMLTWYKEGMEMENVSLLPSNVSTVMLQTGALNTNTGWSMKGSKVATTSFAYAMRFHLAALLIVLHGFSQG